MQHPNNTQDIQLIIAGVESAAELSTLWQLTFRDAYMDVHSAENIDKYCLDNYTEQSARQTLEDKNTLCKIAYRQESALGLYVLKHQPCPLMSEQNTVELKQLYLVASEYGQGLAKLLFDDILLYARSKQFKSIWLCVSDKNHRAQAYYQKLGFQILGTGPTFSVGRDSLSSKMLSLEL